VISKKKSNASRRVRMRELRRALDEMTAARDEACHIAEQWVDKSFGPDVVRLSELKSVGA
jgi:hypothetical protein